MSRSSGRSGEVKMTSRVACSFAKVYLVEVAVTSRPVWGIGSRSAFRPIKQYSFPSSIRNPDIRNGS